MPASHDRVVGKKGPTLAKARNPPLVERAGEFVRTHEGRWRELFENADTISEGAVRDESAGRTYYGTTSLILSLPTGTPEEERSFLVAIAQRDVHIHLHALRSAHREAQSRAPGLLGRVSCELRFSDDRQGLRIDVDVQAPLIERRRMGRSGS